jgi:hypothetical protein
VLAGILVVVGLSLAYSIHETAMEPARAYFVTPTRVWELGTGGVVAALLSRRALGRNRDDEGVPLPLPARSLLAWAGWGVLAVSAAAYTGALPFPSWTAAVPVLGAAAVIAAAHPEWGPDRIKAALTGTASPLPAASGSGAGALDLGAALGSDPARAANGDLFPLRTVGPAGVPVDPASLDGLGWRAGGGGGLRWAPAGGPAGPTAGADDPAAWTAHAWLSGRWTADPAAARSWAAQQWVARIWAARRWAVAGLGPAGWAALQWSWGGVLAATLDGPVTGATVDWVARSWAARSWAERAWGPEDLAARSWAARSWAELALEARSWAARSWAGIDWSARSWASRRWTAGSWAARSWAHDTSEGG